MDNAKTNKRETRKDGWISFGLFFPVTAMRLAMLPACRPGERVES